MNKPCFALVAAMVCSAAVLAKDPGIGKPAYLADKKKVEAQYHSEKEACAPLKNNPRDVCDAQARGNWKAGLAELQARYRPSPKATEQARLERARADYDVAREKCQVLKGDAKHSCWKEAKAVYEGARKQARTERRTAEKSSP